MSDVLDLRRALEISGPTFFCIMRSLHYHLKAFLESKNSLWVISVSKVEVTRARLLWTVSQCCGATVTGVSQWLGPSCHCLSSICTQNTVEVIYKPSKLLNTINAKGQLYKVAWASSAHEVMEEQCAHENFLPSVSHHPKKQQKRTQSALTEES